MRNLLKGSLCLFFMVLIFSSAKAQHGDEQAYYWPEDSLVQENLQQWQDWKFGLLMHWGPYSQWGVVESWSICPEDEDWCQRRGPMLMIIMNTGRLMTNSHKPSIR